MAGHAQQNGEQLNNVLKSLHGFYGRPGGPWGHRAEFEGYFLLLQLGNPGAAARHLQALEPSLLREPPLLFALQAWAALKTHNHAKVGLG